MKKYRLVFLAVWMLTSAVLSGCGEQDSGNDGTAVEELCDSLLQYRTIPTSSGEYTFDFDALREVNPDIHAWIEIPGTGVDYPVLQSPEDDEVYLYTAPDGSPYIGGSVFTQASYNSTVFDDPVTLLYGNTMLDGTMFGSLQTIYPVPPAADAAEGEILIYLPDEVCHYTVFAAVPYDNTHILYTYNFAEKYWYGNFFSGIRKIRSIDAWYDEENAPEYCEEVIVLSTSRADGSDGRYLVMAVLHDAAGNSGDTP